MIRLFSLIMIILAIICVVAGIFLGIAFLVMLLPAIPVLMVPFLIWFYGKETKYDRRIMEWLL